MPSSAFADVTYATAVVEFLPGHGAGPELPDRALGPPDGSYGNYNDCYVGLGRGYDLAGVWQGSLTLQMGLPFGNGPLTVFEVGHSYGAVDDPYDVWVGPDLQVEHFVFVGHSTGDKTVFTFWGNGSTGPFNYVRILDKDTSGYYNGADIDAVEATVPEPATTGLLAIGFAGMVMRRRQVKN